MRYMGYDEKYSANILQEDDDSVMTNNIDKYVL